MKVAAAAGIIVLVAAWRFIFPNSFLSVLAPLSRAGTSLSGGFAGFSAGWSDKAALARERDALTASLAEMTAERDKLAAEVEDLTRQEGTRGLLPKGVLASVLVRPPVAPYDSVVIDSGSKAGVSAGDLALAAGGVPVGRVTAVTADFSRITLFSSSGVETSVLLGADRLPETLLGTGAGGFSLSLSKPATGTTANVGDRVYFSYDGASPIGTVRSIVTSPSSVDETLLISGDVNPFTLVWLTIVPYAPTLPASMVATSTSSS